MSVYQGKNNTGKVLVILSAPASAIDHLFGLICSHDNAEFTGIILGNMIMNSLTFLII